MDSQPWKWRGDAEVLVGPKEVAFRLRETVKREDILSFGREVVILSRTFQVLREAYNSFRLGLANYEGANQTLRHLIPEHDQAARDLRDTQAGFAQFWEPVNGDGGGTGMMEALGGREPFSLFIREAITKLTGEFKSPIEGE